MPISSGASRPLPPRSIDAVEQVLLHRGAVRDPVVVHVAVDLRGDHERDVRVAEVAEGPLQEARQRHVVGVHLGDHVVVVLVLGAPGVVVAGLGLGAERAGRLVVLRPALAAEVVDAQARGHLPYGRVVALVEDPDVDGAVSTRPPAWPRSVRSHDVDRLLGRHDRGQHGDPQPDSAGSIGIGSLAWKANTQIATFCTSRISSTAMTTQNPSRARSSLPLPRPITPGPGTCSGSSSQPMNDDVGQGGGGGQSCERHPVARSQHGEELHFPARVGQRAAGPGSTGVGSDG